MQSLLNGKFSMKIFKTPLKLCDKWKKSNKVAETLGTCLHRLLLIMTIMFNVSIAVESMLLM